MLGGTAQLPVLLPGRPGLRRLSKLASTQLSYSLKCLNGGYIRDYTGEYYRGYSGGCHEFKLLVWRI